MTVARASFSRLFGGAVFVLAVLVVLAVAQPHASAASRDAYAGKRALRCALTIDVARARKLARTPAQRRTLRARHAIQVRRVVKGRRATVLACVRTASQQRATRRLVAALGARTDGDRTFQVVTGAATLDKRLTIALPNHSSGGWRMLDVPAVAPQTYERGMTYSTPQFDLVQNIGVGHLDEQIAVHQRLGSHTWRWKLVYDGGAAPRILHDGSVRFGDTIRIDPPFVQNVAGKRIRDLAWQLRGDVLSLTVDDATLPVPYVIDPASSYPQRVYPLVSYVTGSSNINDLNSALTNTNNAGTGLVSTAVGEGLFWSNGGSSTYFPAGGVNDTTRPTPYQPGAASTAGQYGWGQDALGGATLAPGPYTVSGRVRYTATGGGMVYPTVAIKARLWKAKLSGGNLVAPFVPITSWSNASAAQTFTATGAGGDRTFTTTFSPLSAAVRQLAPDDHVYVEYAGVITAAGKSGSSIKLIVDSANTYIDFGAAATNSPGFADNLRVAAPTTNLTGYGWTSDNTPAFRADLDDPDYYHHIEYQVCTTAACTTVSKTGTSTFGQMIGSTNDSWTTTALTDGWYYLRARTVEDTSPDPGGTGAWTTITPTTCTALDVGACSAFGVDTVVPTGSISTAAGAWMSGTVSISGTANDAMSGVDTVQLQWKRLTPTAAGPSSTGVTCAGPHSPTWTCSWDTTQVADGTYELDAIITDKAGLTSTIVKTTFKVDNIAPAWPGGSYSRDGAAAGDLTWFATPTSMGSNWSAATDANTVTGYEYCLSTATNCAGTVVKGWTSNATTLTETSTGLTLTEGTLYYACVRALDPAGNVSAPLCSNGQTLDSKPPAIAAVNDGTGADIEWNTTPGSIAANWPGSIDAGSGVNKFEYCIATAADCGGTVLKTWTSTGTTTNVSLSGLGASLVEGQLYYVSVRATDNLGNATTTNTNSNGQRVDTVPSPAPTSVADGTGADIAVQSNTTTLSANWASVTDTAPGVGVASGLAKYQYCVTTSSAGADCAGAATAPWTDSAIASVTRTGLALADGATYYTCVRSFDVAGNAPIATKCSNGVKIDGVPPTWTGAASRDGVGPGDVQWTNSLTTLSSNWDAATDANGVGLYEFCLSTATNCGGTVVKAWSGNATSLSQTSTSLALANGTTYYSCVRATDTAGNTSALLCSNGQTVDTTVPGVPSSVNDGVGPDIQWVSSLTTLSANWLAASDGAGPGASGINRYEYCIATAANCAGTVVRTWTSVGPALTVTALGLTLTEGQSYVVSVRSIDNAGNVSTTTTSSNGQTVDTIPATPPTTVYDGAVTGTDIALQNSATTINANWTAGGDSGSGIKDYAYCISTSATGADCAGAAVVAWTANAGTSVSKSGLSLVDGTTYYVCVRSNDLVGNAPTAATCSNGVKIDGQPPTWPVGSKVLDGVGPADAQWTTSLVQLQSLWSAASDPNGVANYEYCLSTATNCGGTVVKTWTSTGTTRNQTSTGLSLSDTVKYFTCVRATDTGGNTGVVLCSDGQTVDVTSPGVPASVNDGAGADITWLGSTTALAANWPAASDGALGSGIAMYEYCVSTATGCSGTTVVNWTSNGTATSLSLTGLTLTEGQQYFVTIRTSDVAGNTSSTTVSSNGQRVDTLAPANAGPVNDGSGADVDFWPSISSVTANFPAFTDASSGVQTAQYCITTTATGSDCTGAATVPWTALASPTATSFTKTGLSLADGTLYTVCVRATDVAGITSTPVCSDGFKTDGNPPVASWVSWTENSKYLYSPSGSKLWYNPAATAEPGIIATATVRASDAGSSINRVNFPNLAAAGTAWGAGGDDTTGVGTSSDEYSWDYTFNAASSIVDPATNNATAYDNGGSSTGAPALTFNVDPDATGPAVPAMSSMDGLYRTTPYLQTVSFGTDADSGIARYVQDVRFAPLVNGVCQAWDPWQLGDGVAGMYGTASNGGSTTSTSYVNDLAPFDGIADYHDSFCYQSRYRVFDNVENMSTIDPVGVAMFDFGAPSVNLTAPANNANLSGPVTFSGDATDLYAGTAPEYPNTGTDIASVSITVQKGAGPVVTACGPLTTFGGATWSNRTFSCSWNSGSVIDGTYTAKITATDSAGNVTTITRTYLIDNYPPAFTFDSWTETSPNAYASGSTAWVKPDAPAGSITLVANSTATDGGSGVNRVEFPPLGTNWTPTGVTNATLVSTPAIGSYHLTYVLTTPTGGAAPGTKTATAYDGADNPTGATFKVLYDSAGPSTGQSVSNPNGYVASTSVSVTFNTGDDAAGESGVASWRLLRASGTLSGGTCTAFGGYTTVVASGTAVTTSGSATDTVSDPGCFKYRIETTDRVGNVAPLDGTNVVKVDLTPPSGSIVLATGTNPQYQYLASPTKLYVNTSFGTSGDFTATTNVTAASGVLDVTFPNIGTNFTGDGSKPGPGPTVATTYAWSSPAGAPATGLAAAVRSNSLGSLSLPFQVIGDAAGPTGGSVTHAAGYVSSTGLTVGFTVGTDGTGSGVASYQLERESGTLAGGVCTFTGTWVAAGAVNGPLSISDTLAHANCYRYRVRMTDNVGNVGYSPSSANVMVDTTPPTSGTVEFVENGTGVGTSLATTTSTNDTIYYQPTLGTAVAKERFTMRVRIVDPESGAGTVTFPSFTGNWLFGGPATTNADGQSRTYDRWNYANQPAAGSGAVTAVATNGAGLTISATGYVVLDDAVSSAANWNIAYAHGFDTTHTTALTIAQDATDNLAGFQSATLVRRAYPYSTALNRCDETSFTDTVVGPVTGASMIESGLVQPICYRWFVDVQDKAENTTRIAAASDGNSPALFPSTWPTWNVRTVAEVDDFTPPANFALTQPTNPTLPAITTGAPSPACAATPTFTSATPAFTWAASNDLESGLRDYKVYVDVASPAAATVVQPATTWTPATALTDGAHTWGVTAIDNMNNATNSTPAYPAAVRVDANAPTSAVASAPSGGSWTSDTTPTFTWSAADANCIARVQVFVDNMTTPVAVASGTETSWTPSSAMAAGTHTWKIVAIDSGNHALSSSVATFGIDDVPPSVFAITAPSAGQTVRGFVDVTWSAATDADSGLPGTGAYEVWVDGALKTAVGSAVTTARVTGITLGTHSVVVKAYDVVGNVRTTAAVTFTGFGAIPVPMLDSPANGSAVSTSPTLAWHWPSDTGPAPTNYDVEIDGGVVASALSHPTGTYATSLAPGIHQWRIIQHDPYTGTVSSTTWQFNIDTTAPDTSGTLTRSGTVVSWPAIVDPAAPVASGVQTLEFIIVNGATTVRPVVPGATSYDYGVLPDGIYQMSVRATDFAGNVATSTPITVINDSQPPDPFTLIPPAALPALPTITAGPAAPACEAAPTYVGGTPAFNWNPSNDSLSGLASYDIMLDGAGAPSGTVLAGTTTWSPATSLAGGAHTWLVVAKDSFGNPRNSTPAPMNVRVDAAPPVIVQGTPTAGQPTSNTRPTLTWTETDDNCAARVELTLDGTVINTYAASVTSFTPGTALAEGSHTWSLRVWDSAGNVVASGNRTFVIDTTGPTGVTAVNPTDNSTPDEGMFTFQWSAGSDAGSSVDHYDLVIDNAVVRTGITGTSQGTFPIHMGAHTWAIKAYDSVGNVTTFPFGFNAQFVPDNTPPDPFNLLTPADNSTLAPGTPLTWETATDFNGIGSYRVYLDGVLAATTNASTTSFTPAVGVGSPICNAAYDPATSAGCIGSPQFSQGHQGVTDVAPSSAMLDWGVRTYAGWVGSGGAIGVGNPTLAATNPSSGFDGDRQWTAMTYDFTVPAAGADLKFEHRIKSDVVGDTVHDGGVLEMMVDVDGGGFGNDTWKGVCDYQHYDVTGTTIRCGYPIIDAAGAPNAVMQGQSADDFPTYDEAGWAGNSGSSMLTTVRLGDYAGKHIQLRWVLATDVCYTGIASTSDPNAFFCAAGGNDNPEPAQWYIDNLALTTTGLTSGPHTWTVRAVDTNGNVRPANQTWNITIP